VNCKKAEKFIRNLILVVFTKLENLRGDGGKSESHIVFHCCFRESLAFFCFNICEYSHSQDFENLRSTSTAFVDSRGVFIMEMHPKTVERDSSKLKLERLFGLQFHSFLLYLTVICFHYGNKKVPNSVFLFYVQVWEIVFQRDL
jgi:Na+/melibiose symporter-like transporter